MTDISATPHAAAAAPAPAELVACAHCGHMDSGTYCSACGKELVEDASRTVAHEVWELVVVNRLNNAKEYATTTWYLLARPTRFFVTALARPAARARHAFPEPAPQALRPGLVQGPVAFYLVSFVAAILVGKVTGAQVGEGLIPGLDDDFNNEISMLLLLLACGVYGAVFRWTSGRRISTEEAAIVSAYTMGAATAIFSLVGVIPHAEIPVGILWIYLLFGIPLTVLPRLYGMSRRRVLLAQMVAGFGALMALGLMATVIEALTGTAAAG